MRLKTSLPILAFVSVALLTSLPVVAASPITASLNWSNQHPPAGGSSTATFGVSSDSDCPAGDFFSGTVTVTTPGGLTSEYSVSNVACGTTNLSAVYPTDFAAGGINPGAPSTSTSGVYNAVWQGTTTATVGGFHPTFKVTDALDVGVFPPPIPQFGGPAILVAAMGLVLVAAAKKGRLFKI